MSEIVSSNGNQPMYADRFAEYAPVYARLAARFMEELIRRKGMNEIDAHNKALEVMLGQAMATIQGLDQIDLALKLKPRLGSGVDVIEQKS